MNSTHVFVTYVVDVDTDKISLLVVASLRG